MFENRTDKELKIIYLFIALIVALALTAYNLASPFFPKNTILIVVVANVWFFCIYFMLYYPIYAKNKKKK